MTSSTMKKGPGLFQRLSSMFSGGSNASSIYHRAFDKAKLGNSAGAIDDYSRVINSEDAPAELRAMALANRAYAYSTSGRYQHAAADLEAVLALPGAPANVKSAAKQKLARLQKRLSKG